MTASLLLCGFGKVRIGKLGVACGRAMVPMREQLAALRQFLVPHYARTRHGMAEIMQPRFAQL